MSNPNQKLYSQQTIQQPIINNGIPGIQKSNTQLTV
jgi:hypothetical protein